MADDEKKDLQTKRMPSRVPASRLQKDSFLFLKDPQNNQVKRIIAVQDLQVGLKDSNYPGMGLILQPHTPPADVSNRLYNNEGTLYWNGVPVAGGGTGDITSVTAGDGLSGGGTSGDVTLSLDISNLTEVSSATTSDFVAIQDVTDGTTKKVLLSSLPGDISSVTAGNGLLGGGTSGDVTLEINDNIVATISGSQFSGNVGITPNLSVTGSAIFGDSIINTDTVFLVSGAIDPYDGTVYTGTKNANFKGDIVTSGSIIGAGSFYGSNPEWLSLVGGTHGNGTIHGYAGSVILESYQLTTGPRGADIFLSVSGSKNSRGTSVRGTSVFGGDVVISGTLYAEKMVIEVDETVTGSLMISGSLIVSQSAEIKEGLVVNSSGECGAENDFRVQTDNFTHALFVDSCADRVLVLSGGASTSLNESNASDVNFYVSGSVGSRGSATKGTSVFGGDMAISGALYISDYLYHMGDDDTFIQFADDAIGITAGGEQLITISESGQDIVKIGDGGDVDFQVRTLSDDNTLYVKGDTDRVGIGTNAPSSILHIKEAGPTLTLQRENNSNGSTINFVGAAGSTANSIIHDSSTNDLVFKTFNGSTVEEILRVGDHYGVSNRQVIFLSGSGMHPAATQPRHAADIGFFVSGSMGSRNTLNKGASVFGGDTIASGTIYAGVDSSEIRGLDVYANVSRDYAAIIDNDNSSSGHGLKVTSDGTGAGTYIFDIEHGSTTFFRARGDGKVGIGKVSSLPAAVLTVSSSNTDGDLAIAHKIQHLGDPDTHMQFDNNEILFTAGDVSHLELSANSVLPGGDLTISLGSEDRRFANIYTGDLHLRNERGDWTIVEEAEYLTVVNNLNGKRYKMMLELLE